MSSRVAAAGTKNNYVLVPPPNFCFMEDCVSRCTFPLSLNNVAFLKSNGIGIVVNLCSNKSCSSALETLLVDQNITVVCCG